ncbi:hypothetical protein ABN225_09590 [Providencia alcalifaciens]
MTLGPAKLPLNNNINRMILRRKKYRFLFKDFIAGKIQWNDPSLANLKQMLRINLRIQQDGRCIYCRRLILLERRNVYEDIEHFLDKSRPKYRKWAFSYLNLSLACHACNFEKSTKDLGVLNQQNSKRYLAGIGIYKWLHPYFDDYHANLAVEKGWTYSVRQGAPAAVQAFQMIEECKLGKIEATESYSEAIKEKIYRLTILAGKASKRQRPERTQRLIDASIRYQNEVWYDY